MPLTAREMNRKARVFWTKQATLRKQNPDLFQIALEHMHLEQAKRIPTRSQSTLEELLERQILTVRDSVRQQR